MTLKEMILHKPFEDSKKYGVKQKHILNSAKYYLFCKGLENSFVRIDVIELVVDVEHVKYKLNHLKGVL